MEGFFGAIKDLDVYRKVPKDLTEATVSGAIVSIIAAIVITTLFLSEFIFYLSVQTESEMFVNEMNYGTKLRINMNMTFSNLPCAVVSLDAQDVMGSHTVDVGGALVKKRVDKKGRFVAIEKEHQSGGHSHSVPQINDELKKELEKQKNEGCQLEGYIVVNKVPGNFHVSSHAMAPLLPYVGIQDALKLDVRHTVHSLSFVEIDTTEQDEMDQLRQLSGSFHPLDGVKRMESSLVGMTMEYYLKIVPSIYDRTYGSDIHAYQFTANTNEMKHDRMLPAVYFRYDISPITVKYSHPQKSFLHFCVQLCAIIGGVFTVAGLVNRAVHRSLIPLMKKMQIGKLA